MSIEKNQLVVLELELEKGNWGREREHEDLLCAQCLPYAAQSTNITMCQVSHWAGGDRTETTVQVPAYLELTVSSRHEISLSVYACEPG